MEPPLPEITSRIRAHLKRMENDPTNNLETLSGSVASLTGRYVSITYVSKQPSYRLTREEAVAYLNWLDAGNAGRHTDMQA